MVRGQRRVKASTASYSKSVNNINYGNNISLTAASTKITSYFSPDVNIENSYEVREENHLPPVTPCTRMSPRKHASTLSVLQLTNNNVTPIKSPHKIEITFEVAVVELNDNDQVENSNIAYNSSVTLTQPPKKLPRIVNKTLSKPKNNLPMKPEVNSILNKDSGKRDITDFFPVRRSVRKTKKAVLEEMQKSLENAVISKKEDGLKVQVFPGKGRGVVATRPFEKGEFVVEYAGDLITTEEAKEREAYYSQDINAGCYMYYFLFKNCQYCVDATPESDRLGRLVNHSRNGNLLTKIIVVQDKPHLVLTAKEFIAVGEELTYDYGDRSKESLRYHPWLAF